tara:strand:+ start:10228 stop:10587 length:360 start_codon:yes stop_codon:yes gene_type:complete
MNQKKNSTSFLNEKHVKGVISELRATEILLDLGFLVFSNVAPNGLIDLVAISPDNETFRIDVKTRSLRKTRTQKRKIGSEIYRSPTKMQVSMDVVVMIVDSDSWKVHPIRSNLAKWLKL